VRAEGGEVTGCLISWNQTRGVLCGRGVVSFRNSVIAHNGDWAISGPSEARIINTTVADNQAGINLSGNAEIRNSIVLSNHVTPQIAIPVGVVSFSCVEAGYPGLSNITFNPLFADDDRFRLLDGSLCMDTGDPSTEFNDVCFPPSLGTTNND